MYKDVRLHYRRTFLKITNITAERSVVVRDCGRILPQRMRRVAVATVKLPIRVRSFGWIVCGKARVAESGPFNGRRVESWNCDTRAILPSWLGEILVSSRACQSCHSRVILSFCFIWYRLCRAETIIVIVSHFRVYVSFCVNVTLSDNVYYFGYESRTLSCE